MTWLLVAPERVDDDVLANSAWVAEKTRARAAHAPTLLTGAAAVRANFERQVTDAIGGVAFFGHGAPDRLYDANRAPRATGPALLDAQNLAILRGRWLHAYACHSGKELAPLAAANGLSIFVGYKRPLDAGWAYPPSAEQEFIELVTSTTLLLLAGVREERDLRAAVSRAADAFVVALEAIADEEKSLRWMWLHALAQQLVDDMVVVGQ